MGALHEKSALMHGNGNAQPRSACSGDLLSKCSRNYIVSRLLALIAVRFNPRVCGLQGDGQYSNVYRLAEAHFMHIREAVAQESAPATLKAAFLEPVSRGLATDLSVHLFARTDQQFMSWFTCALLLSRADPSASCQLPLTPLC